MKPVNQEHPVARTHFPDLLYDRPFYDEVSVGNPYPPGPHWGDIREDQGNEEEENSLYNLVAYR